MGTMKTNLRIGAAAGALILAGLGLASPGLASDDGKGARSEGKVEKVIVVTRHGDRDGPGDEKGRIRTFSFNGVDVDCDGERNVRESSDDGHRRIVICTRGKGGEAGRARVRAFSMVDCRGDRARRESRDGDRQRIVICRRDGAGGGDHVRTFAFNGVNVADCGGERTVRESGEDGRRTRIVVCSSDGEGPGPDMQATRLERVLERINSSDDLTAEQKERVSAALREAIAQLRTAH